MPGRVGRKSPGGGPSSTTGFAASDCSFRPVPLRCPRSVHRKRRFVPDRRDFLRSGLGAAGALGATSLVFSVCYPTRAWAQGIVAVRVWPAPEYSRVTIETDRPLEATHFMVDHPDRLVVDIEGLALDTTL